MDGQLREREIILVVLNVYVDVFAHLENLKIIATDYPSPQ